MTVCSGKWGGDDQRKQQETKSHDDRPHEEGPAVVDGLRHVVTRRKHDLICDCRFPIGDWQLELPAGNLSEPDDGIRPTFDMQSIDETDVAGFGCHNHRMRSFPRPEESYALQQSSVSDSGGRKNYLLAGR